MCDKQNLQALIDNQLVTLDLTRNRISAYLILTRSVETDSLLHSNQCFAAADDTALKELNQLE
jgi:hypothetical protein